MTSYANNFTTFTDMLIILIVVMGSTSWIITICRDKSWDPNGAHENNVKNYDIKFVSWAADIWSAIINNY